MEEPQKCANTELTPREERQVKHVIYQVTEPLNVSEFQKMRKAGYSVSYSRHPGVRKGKKNFRELLEAFFPDGEVLSTHIALKDSRRVDHMTFPTSMEDSDIEKLLSDTNCFLRKIVHGEQAKHAYFWAPDNKARKEALDMIYKLKGHYAPEKIEDVTDIYKNLTTEELLKRKQEALAFYKKKK